MYCSLEKSPPQRVLCGRGSLLLLRSLGSSAAVLRAMVALAKEVGTEFIVLGVLERFIGCVGWEGDGCGSAVGSGEGPRG